MNKFRTTDVHEWYESNKLVINTSKSNVMLLTTRQMLSNMRDTALNVFTGNHKLPQCNSIKYLGVDIDNVLSWNLQTDSISKKLVFIIFRLSRLKPVLPSQMLMYIYTSIIQPKIDYAISIWGNTTAHNTVVPATAGHRWFRGKVALRGRWPLVTGNGHMRHYVKSNTHIRQHISQHMHNMLYRPTVRDETNNAENV